MNIIVNVQYASNESELPNKDKLTKWVSVALQYQASSDSPPLNQDPDFTFSNHDNQRSLVEEPLLARKKLELTIRIVDETESRQLNETWRKCQGATNVLSFPFQCPPGIKVPLLGDIIICAPLVVREAKQQHKSLDAHWAHLVIHGTLHLLGYDHLEEVQAQRMEHLEIQALHHLGYPNPYHIP